MAARKTKILFLIICLLQLFYLFNFRSGFRYEIIKDPFNENSGITYAVSNEVIELKNILKRNKMVHFNLSKKLKDDDYFYQRSLEFNYPIRINQSSKLVFFSINEDISEKCKVIETGKYLKLTQC
jgi:hypothetical protein|tara:strand:- start:263 stop:637 length:375 start_codon:yes stop_codon:yes gene_type:complete